MTAQQFESISAGLPSHQEELMGDHQGTPGTGVPAPAEDHGVPDDAKYGSGGL